MEIRELLLKHYGKFENHRITLKPGINIIYGGNETGKSTIHSFIYAMFFGLNRSRGRAARTDEYQIRQPWDTPGAFLGSMKVQDGEMVYRVDRCFDRSMEPLRVTCETTAQEADQPELVLETLLGGISESAFVNTVFIPQTGCETEEVLAEELRRYMVNSDSAMDAELDVSQALQSLRRQKKALEQQKKAEDEKLEAVIGEKQRQAEEVRAELETLKTRGEAQATGPSYGNGAFSYESGQMSALPSVRSGRYEDFGEEGEYREASPGPGGLVLELLLALAGILALAAAFFLSEWKLKVFLGVFGVVFLLMLLPVHFLIGDGKEEDDEEAGAEDFLSEEDLPETDSGSGGRLAERILARETEYRKLQDELEQLYGSHVGFENTDAEIAAVTMAIDRICELSAGIYEKSGSQLNERASEILAQLTQGAYTRIRLDETSEVRIHTPSRTLGLHQVSGGTMQQVYFALRMAAGELLGQGKELPVILDEAFAMYDDARLEAVLRWLRQSGRQVILFTCQKREREILRRLDAGAGEGGA